MDKASTLDDAIDYLKTLKLQLQVNFSSLSVDIVLLSFKIVIIWMPLNLVFMIWCRLCQWGVDFVCHL